MASARGLSRVILYAIIGVFIFWLCFVIVDKITPYDLWREIVEKQNRGPGHGGGRDVPGNQHHRGGSDSLTMRKMGGVRRVSAYARVNLRHCPLAPWRWLYWLARTSTLPHSAIGSPLHTLKAMNDFSVAPSPRPLRPGSSLPRVRRG